MLESFTLLFTVNSCKADRRQVGVCALSYVNLQTCQPQGADSAALLNSNVCVQVSQNKRLHPDSDFNAVLRVPLWRCRANEQHKAT